MNTTDEEETTMNTTDKVAQFAHETVDAVADASHQARAAFDEKSDQIMNAEQQLLKNCQTYVRENPVTSLGLAVAGGFLLSRLLSR
ncbi:MAG: hypothetical protein CG439_1439 [Methylococcaceae bacterium NSP1-2]|nr:MAG: hypothetical protein CG439_1439 [Methylococcaceae bacterium NSP1-2]